MNCFFNQLNDQNIQNNVMVIFKNDNKVIHFLHAVLRGPSENNSWDKSWAAIFPLNSRFISTIGVDLSILILILKSQYTHLKQIHFLFNDIFTQQK